MKIFAIVTTVFACLSPTVSLALSGNGSPLSPYDDGSWQGIEVAATPLSPEKGPADEYFGKFKFSNLGIRNIVHDLRIQGVSPVALQSQRFHIEEARSALAMWNDIYPRDPWIPSTMLQFADQMRARQQADLDITALYFYTYLGEHFSGHYFGNLAEARMRGYDPTPPYDLTDSYAYPPLDNAVDAKYPQVR